MSLRHRREDEPELAERLAEQRRAVRMAQSAAAQVEAPAALRARVEALRAARAAAPAPHRLVLLGATAAAALAVGSALVVARSGTSTERFHAALAPTALAPGAGAEATLTRTSSGWRIDLDASGLPALRGGRFYEAWLRDPAGMLVPAGTFNEGPMITLWAGVSPKDFRMLVVTREHADGNQASSGESVLVGPVDIDAAGAVSR